MKTIFTVNLINEKGEITYSTDFVNKTEAMMYIKRMETANTLEGLRAVIKEYVDEKPTEDKEVLANFTCEQLLFEVHRRNNIYISGWWNSDHIQEYTGLPSEYHTAFIKYCNDKAVGGEVDEAFEQWLEYIKEYLETYIAESIAERYELSKEEADLFSDCVQVDYDVELGFTPTLERPASDFAGTTFWDSSSDLARKLTEICRPHQGNIKTYIEEAMQELINDYFN